MRPVTPCFLFATLLLSLLSCTDVWTAQPDPMPEESDLVKAEKEVALRLAELTRFQEEEEKQQKKVLSLQGELEPLKQAPRPDTVKIRQKEAELHTAQDNLTRAQEASKAARELYEKAKEKHLLAKKNAVLASPQQNNRTNDKPADQVSDPFEKQRRIDQAKLEATLAQRKTDLLREQLELLLQRRKEIREDLDEINRQLTNPQTPAAQHPQLNKEKDRLIQGSRSLQEQIQKVRFELWTAETQQRLKEERAQQEVGTYEKWKNELFLTAGLIAGLLIVTLLSRLVLVQRIQDPNRRYYIKRSFSLLFTSIFFIGLVFIFANKFSNLLTMLGLALAGMTVVLQDVISSFVAWFFIRGARAYRVGDWIQLGEQCGEVIDITFLRTTLQQAWPFHLNENNRGGHLTGGITTLMNNTIFKYPLVNYTRGFPFLWCSLRYTLTFESDWETAKQQVLLVLKEEPEIKGTAERAREKIHQMAEDFSIKNCPTDPDVLTWAAINGVELSVWFMAHPRRRVALIDKVNGLVLRTLAHVENVHIAYHTIRSVADPFPPTLPGLPGSEPPQVIRN